jgi:hypothetical protein
MNALTYLISAKVGKIAKEYNGVYTDSDEGGNYSLQRYEVGWSEAIEDSNTILQEFCVLVFNVKANIEVIKEWYTTVVVDRVALEALVAQIQVLNADHKQEKNKLIGKVNGYLFMLQKLNDMEMEL